eukprot:TRINITY_DN1202_c0_g1_i1.p1 TRINITY_DN1202_c0_g1~~TRINITY_DN1202_c0_g1_i1.p1  ORF type:complete len:195 (+),score=25.93 TRINITY_DN1202_c0_g1_i1:96-680(+)
MASARSSMAATLAILLLLSPLSAYAQDSGNALINAMNNHCCLKKFLYALQQSQVETDLRDRANQGPITVFAWKDEVIAKLDPQLYNCATTGQGPEDILSEIVLYHIVTDGKLNASQVAAKQQLTSASGMLIDVKVENGVVLLDEYASVVEAGVIVTPNAIVHLINEVLVPETVIGTINSLCGSPASASLPSPGL